MKIVFLDAKTIGEDIDLSGFDALGEVVKYGFSTAEEARERSKDADILILNKLQVNQQTIGEADHLKLVCVTATGTNNLDKEYLDKRGIAWRNVAGYSTESVAQHTFAMLFYLLEKLPYYDNYVKSEKYVNDVSFTHFAKAFHELSGMTYGIIGLGNIGRRMADIAKAFGCRVIYYSTSGRNSQPGYERVSFDELLERCGIPRPEGRTVFTLDEALQAAQEVGYPVLMRPSYVLGGQNMIVAYNSSDVIEYMGVITKHVDMSHPVLMDKYILGTECEVDAICDGTDYLVPGIMQQVERTGVHSGDSICVYPPTTFSQKVIDTLVDYTGRFARELKVVGLVNVQYAVQNDRVYVIEVNPRSSRTVPYISKVTGVPMVDLAVRCTLGEKLKDMGYGTGLWRDGKSPYYAVKVPVYSFLKLHGVDTMLGPEMKSTGEVLGIAPTFHEAMMKGLVAAGYQFKTPGPGSCVIISVKDSDKAEAAELAWKLHDYGYKIYGTPGTARYLNSEMVPCSVVRQMSGARPNVIDLLESGLVDYIISTSPHGRDPHRDSVKFRRKATELSIPTITALDTARVLVDALRGDHDISQMELVDIANLHREAASGK